MNSVENFIAIDLRLNWIDVLKVVILLMNYLKTMCFTKQQDLNLRVFNMTAGINESKTSTNHISRECKCRFGGRKSN